MYSSQSKKSLLPVELADILQFHSLSSLSLSPDGTRAAFMDHQCNKTQDGYDSNLWVCDLNSRCVSAVTTDNSKQVFCWTADGEFAYANTGQRNRIFSDVHKWTNTVCFFGAYPCQVHSARNGFPMACGGY